MLSQIYIIHEKIKSNFKIGSTCNFNNRIGSYITPCDYFDNSTHFIVLYDILSEKYTCYQLDWIIQQLSTNYSYPFVKLVGNTGGTEFYKLDDFNKLDDFFNKLDIKFTKTIIDIDEFRKLQKLTLIDISNAVITDYDNFNSHSISSVELESMAQLLELNKPFQLKQLQLDIRNLFNNFKERFSHLIISPTGTGKTVIFTLLLCDYIIKHKKDVIIITKKKEILSQLPQRINNYIKSFVKSKIINNFDYDIVNCIGDCSTEKLNNKSKSPQIYIVNWDKLTSSSKTNYLDVDWNKFGFIIPDESHWIGANGIYEVMSHIKEKTSVNYIGFFATPVRCSLTNQTRILDIFGNKKDYFIFYEYSYYQALVNKDICPIKYQVISIETSDLVTDDYFDDELNDNEFDKIPDKNNKIIKTNNYSKPKVLSPTAYFKIWTKLNSQIISKTNFKKGIMWFRSRKDLLKFYIWTRSNVKGFNFIPTMSYSKVDNNTILNLIKDADLMDYDFDNAINEFIGIKSNSILLSVFRFVEGSDDDILEFGVKMFYSESDTDFVSETQKMGRFSRWIANDPNGIKKCAYYASLEISDNPEQIRKSLINRFKSWISFVRSFSVNSNNLIDNKIKTKEQIKKEIKEIIDLYVDIDTINTFQIDIQSDIINSYTNSNSDITKISNALKLYNSKSEPNKLIDTKSKYDVWAIKYGYPSCDELIESGFNDFTKLFNLDSQNYLSWIELKKLCKEYQNKYSNLRPIEIYNIMKKDNVNIPDEPEEIYKNKFTCFNNLFL